MQTRSTGQTVLERTLVGWNSFAARMQLFSVLSRRQPFSLLVYADMRSIPTPTPTTDVAHTRSRARARARYDDAAESLIVTDKNEAFIFQIMPDDTALSALWVVRF